jgi:hypothetical protein
MTRLNGRYPVRAPRGRGVPRLLRSDHMQAVSRSA